MLFFRHRMKSIRKKLGTFESWMVASSIFEVLVQYRAQRHTRDKIRYSSTARV